MITLGMLVSCKMSGVLFLSENRRTDIKGKLAISATLKSYLFLIQKVNLKRSTVWTIVGQKDSVSIAIRTMNVSGV